MLRNKALVCLAVILSVSVAEARSPKSMRFEKKDGTVVKIEFPDRITWQDFQDGVQGDCEQAQYVTEYNDKLVYFGHPEWAGGEGHKVMIDGVPHYHAYNFFTGISGAFGSFYNYTHIFAYDTQQECKNVQNPTRVLVGLMNQEGWSGAPQWYVGWERDTNRAYFYPGNYLNNYYKDALQGEVTEWYR